MCPIDFNVSNNTYTCLHIAILYYYLCKVYYAYYRVFCFSKYKSVIIFVKTFICVC